MYDRSRINTQACMDGCTNLVLVNAALKSRREKWKINSEKAIHHLLNNADFHTPKYGKLILSLAPHEYAKKLRGR